MFSVDLSAIGHEVVWVAFGNLMAAIDELINGFSEIATQHIDDDTTRDVHFIAGRMKHIMHQARSIYEAAEEHYKTRGTRRAVTLEMIQGVEGWAASLKSTEEQSTVGLPSSSLTASAQPAAS